MAGYIVYPYCLKFDRGVVYIVVAGYIVYQYFLMFDRGAAYFAVAVLLLPITV
jgi:hypothetical protein